MSEHAEFPIGSARTATSDAAFPSRKAAPPLTPPSNGIGNSRHHYRITVDKLEPTAGEAGLESLSFFASTPHDIVAVANSLRGRLECSACHATKLAVGLGLIREVMHTRRESSLFNEPVSELLSSLEATAKTNA